MIFNRKIFIGSFAIVIIFFAFIVGYPEYKDGAELKKIVDESQLPTVTVVAKKITKRTP